MTATPRFDWGHRVVAEVDLFNDGSYPDHAAGSLLVAKGTAGEVVQVGMHVESNTPVYLVQFPQHVVGCFGNEIAMA